MLGATSSPLAACPNKIRGVYSRPVAGRVFRGWRGAAWGIFSASPCRSGPIDQGAVEVENRPLGVKVGREKSASASLTHAFPPFFSAVRLMGRWAWPIWAADRRRGGAPLRVARVSGHPVARVGSEVPKTSRLLAAFNQFLGSGPAPKLNLAGYGSGCGPRARRFDLKRVGGRLISAVFAPVELAFGLSGPGLETATLGRGRFRVN